MPSMVDIDTVGGPDTLRYAPARRLIPGFLVLVALRPPVPPVPPVPPFPRSPVARQPSNRALVHTYSSRPLGAGQC